MTNFIFKSKGLTKNSPIQIAKLDLLLKEQSMQRSDLNEIKFMLHKLQNNKDLQATVDKFYETAPEGSADPED